MEAKFKIADVVKIVDRKFDHVMGIGIVLGVSEWRNDAYRVETEDGEELLVCQNFGALELREA